MIGARHGKAGPTTYFVLEGREDGSASYREVAVDEAGSG